MDDPLKFNFFEDRFPFAPRPPYPGAFYEFTVSLPPTDNQAYLNRKFSRGNQTRGRILTQESVAFKKEVGFMMMTRCIPFEGGKEWRTAFIAGTMFLGPKRYALRDARGSWKLLEDAIAKHLGFNDRIITTCFLRKVPFHTDFIHVVIGDLNGQELDLDSIKTHFGLYSK